jgi:hypothetical protein
MVATVCLSCDEKPSVVADAAAEGGTVVSTATVSSPPPQPKPPVVTVDDSSFVVAGDKVDFAGAGDAKGRITGMLANKPLVTGQTLEVDALRDVTMAHFTLAMDALHDAKVKGLTVKTAQRDRTMGSLDVATDHGAVPPCAAVGMVAKDNAILTWPYSGATAQRFSRGFAGPDITLGSGALRTLGNACDASVYFVAGDDTIKWGVVFDLALAAKSGGSFKPTAVVVLTKTPTPGRKVTE